MNNSKKALTVVFRAVILVTFLIGALYVVNFRKLAVGLNQATDQTTVALVSKWTTTYYLYLGLLVISLIFSIVCFKSTKSWVSTVRTVFLAGSVVCVFAAKSVVDVFRAATKVDIDNPSSVVDVTKGFYDLQYDDMVTRLALPYLSILILFVLAITSVAFFISLYEQNDKTAVPKK